MSRNLTKEAETLFRVTYRSDYPYADYWTNTFVQYCFAFVGALLGFLAVDHGVAIPVIEGAIFVLILSFIVLVFGCALQDEHEVTRVSADAFYLFCLLWAGLMLGCICDSVAVYLRMYMS